tara:strand:+ start:6990 stop:7358 length:369 start_codon:yes stop_codon:yes gene_type:complete
LGAPREDLAWAAGFHDGEGSVVFGRMRGDTPYVQYCITNTYYPALQRFRRIVGKDKVKIYNKKERKPHYKRAWQLSTGRHENVQAIVAMLWPFLSREKQIQARQALSRYNKAKKNDKRSYKS